MEETRICKVCGRELSINEFAKNGMGITHVCKECVANRKRSKREETKQMKQQAQEAANARSLRLKDFTPRELMQELKSRGYEGKLRYVRVEEIDLSKI